jgi:hypothetical protein
MELTTLDPLGAFYLVALDDDWNIRPENLNQQNQISPRPLFSQPPMYAANASGATIASYNIRASQFEYQQRVRADLHSAISRSLGSVTLQSINSKHRFGTGSLSPHGLVRELKTMFGTITKHEIDANHSIRYHGSTRPFRQLPRFLQFYDSKLRVPHKLRIQHP